MGSAGSTIWRVDAFDCIQNEIILRHSEFNNVGGTTGLCNGGAISGRSTGVEGNCYVSQLNVTVAPQLHTKAVICLLTSAGVISTIGNESIIVASGIYITHTINCEYFMIKISNFCIEKFRQTTPYHISIDNAYTFTGSSEAYKSCSHFSKICRPLLTKAEVMGNIGYSVQGLVAK